MTDSSSKNSENPLFGGWDPYDLVSHFCEECGRPKLNRLFFGEMTCQDCATCMEVITRHRCTKRPLEADADDGQRWQCPDCDSIWRMTEHWESCQDCCLDCDHEVNIRRWGLVEEGARIDSAPRYKTPVYTPLRNIFRDDPVKRDKPFQGLPPV